MSKYIIKPIKDSIEYKYGNFYDGDYYTDTIEDVVVYSDFSDKKLDENDIYNYDGNYCSFDEAWEIFKDKYIKEIIRFKDNPEKYKELLNHEELFDHDIIQPHSGYTVKIKSPEDYYNNWDIYKIGDKYVQEEYLEDNLDDYLEEAKIYHIKYDELF